MTKTWSGDLRLNGFITVFEHACRKLAAKEAEVCTLGMSLIAGEDDSTDVKIYVVPANTAAHQAIEEALGRVVTDETVIRGVRYRTSR